MKFGYVTEGGYGELMYVDRRHGARPSAGVILIIELDRIQAQSVFLLISQFSTV